MHAGQEHQLDSKKNKIVSIYVFFFFRMEKSTLCEFDLGQVFNHYQPLRIVVSLFWKHKVFEFFTVEFCEELMVDYFAGAVVVKKTPIRRPPG